METTTKNNGQQVDPFAERQQADVSFVVPCLNEVATIAKCIKQIQEVIDLIALPAEIIVADNGSTDGSQLAAKQLNARVITVEESGYGAAIIAGCQQAYGQYIVIGDADASYDFGESVSMIHKLQKGYDLVLGSRFKGEILPGAMPWKNRYVGNPVLTGLLNLFFQANLSDAHCGLRAITKKAFQLMSLRCVGMEFASEMVVKATLLNMAYTEIPITYYPDGRERRSHLRPWRDGWRHLRFLLIYSPRWLYLQPGILLLTFGITLNTILNLLPESQFLFLGPAFLGTHWTIPATLAASFGLQIVLLGIFMHVYAARSGFYPLPTWVTSKANYKLSFKLEWGLVVGFLFFLLGSVIELSILFRWLDSGFGPLDSFRLAMYGAMWLLLGGEFIFNSFFLSLLMES